MAVKSNKILTKKGKAGRIKRIRAVAPIKSHNYLPSLHNSASFCTWNSMKERWDWRLRGSCNKNTWWQSSIPSPRGSDAIFPGFLHTGGKGMPQHFEDCWIQDPKWHWYLQMWNSIMSHLCGLGIWEPGNKWSCIQDLVTGGLVGQCSHSVLGVNWCMRV